MRLVTLTHDLIRVDGGVFRRGTVLTVIGEYRVNTAKARGVRRLCLGDEAGRVLLPSVEVECVEEAR